MKPTRKQIERAADAIKFKIRLDGWSGAEWTQKGRQETKWPKDFSPDERKEIRGIVKAVLEAVYDKPRVKRRAAIHRMVADAQKLGLP